VLEHIDEPLSVDRTAAKVGMSPRTLSRWCREHLGESPAELVHKLRVEEARRLLEETALPLKDITVRTGLCDTSTLWRAFIEHLGVTPAEYRQRFAAGAERVSSTSQRRNSVLPNPWVRETPTTARVFSAMKDSFLLVKILSRAV
jgi:AraC-like DNA-binding protein